MRPAATSSRTVGRELLFLRNVRHLLGDYAKTGVVHLREVLIVAFGGLFTSADNPFSPRLRHCDSAMRSISTSAVLCAHRFAPFCLEQKLYALAKMQTKWLKDDMRVLRLAIAK
jgi:hypothetical protein